MIFLRPNSIVLSIWIALLRCLSSCSLSSGKENYHPVVEQDVAAPDSFLFSLSTSQGEISLMAKRDWSPKAVDRLYHLLLEHYYDSAYIFRVQKGYVAQFGIAAHSDVSQYWRKHPIPDEPVLVSNRKGTFSYAREGKNSRDTQLFINLDDNPKLDTIEFMGLKGFPPLGYVVDTDSNWGVIEKWNGNYGFGPAEEQEEMYKVGNRYLQEKYPDLDYIISTQVVKPTEEE